MEKSNTNAILPFKFNLLGIGDKWFRRITHDENDFTVYFKAFSLLVAFCILVFVVGAQGGMEDGLV